MNNDVIMREAGSANAVTGYRLSREATLEAAAEARLEHSAYLELRRISCVAQDHVLRLQGHVSSYYLRQIAQTLVQGLEGIEAVDNQLEVLPQLAPRRRVGMA